MKTEKIAEALVNYPDSFDEHSQEEQILLLARSYLVLLQEARMAVLTFDCKDNFENWVPGEETIRTLFKNHRAAIEKLRKLTAITL